LDRNIFMLVFCVTPDLLVAIITKISFILNGSYVMLNALQNCINYARLSLSDKGIKFCGFTLAAAHKPNWSPSVGVLSRQSPWFPFWHWPCLWPACQRSCQHWKRDMAITIAVIILSPFPGLNSIFSAWLAGTKRFCATLCGWEGP